jgi:3-isopropylmalate/(R)-2-methylmalate dehydratase small subunit
MRPLRSVTGAVAVLDRPDVDTDQIIPKQFLKRIERAGYGEFLFYDWMKDPEFELHRTPGASILLAGRNFGCGSSREHAAWALEDHGFRAVLAPSFGDIFRQNAIKNGLLPIALDAAAHARVVAARAADPHTVVRVDLPAQRVSIAGDPAASFGFAIDPFARHCLVHGVDELGYLLGFEDRIAAHERHHS